MKMHWKYNWTIMTQRLLSDIMILIVKLKNQMKLWWKNKQLQKKEDALLAAYILYKFNLFLSVLNGFGTKWFHLETKFID